jgi:hypothetical protein
VHDIAFAKEKFGEVSAVLAGRAGDQCDTIRHPLIHAGLGKGRLSTPIEKRRIEG